MAEIVKREPAFRRVWKELRADILNNKYTPNTPLPTEAELADKHGVSRQTVRRAFQDLVAEDLVFRVAGRGTFITTQHRYIRQLGSIEDLMALSTDSQLEVLKPFSSAVDLSAATRLRLPDDRVISVEFRRIHQEEAICHTQVFLPPMVGVQLRTNHELEERGRLSSITVIGLLDQCLPDPIAEAEQSIAVVSAGVEVAASLGLPRGTPLLRIDRTYFDKQGTPVELAISHFHPDRFSYRVRLRRSPSSVPNINYDGVR